jgi:type II secretory pathway pseudopilin PulG
MTRPAQAGFTYLTVLFVVAFMGLGMAMAGKVYRTTVLRAREADLLWVGNQYRRAIEAYTKRGGGLYPRSLDDLLKDPRDPGVRRYLRRRYPDPITGSDEWGIVKAADGGIMGVYSRSEGPPLKTAGFRIADAAFEDASAKYSDWKFVYAPGTPGAALPVPQAPAPSPAAPAGAPPPAPDVPAR